MSGFLHFDGMAWPDPADPLEVEYALRYGTPTRAQALTAASFVAAYKQMVGDTQHRRNANVAFIREASSTGGRDG